jgi:hypothetical protein
MRLYEIIVIVTCYGIVAILIHKGSLTKRKQEHYQRKKHRTVVNTIWINAWTEAYSDKGIVSRYRGCLIFSIKTSHQRMTFYF